MYHYIGSHAEVLPMSSAHSSVHKIAYKILQCVIKAYEEK